MTETTVASKHAAKACLTKRFQQLDLPGLAYCATRRGVEIMAGGLGTGDADGHNPVDADTLFGVASITKIVTAILVMRAEQDGKLQLDDRVSAHLTDLEIARATPMLIRHLLSHSAGLPGLPFRFQASVPTSQERGAEGLTEGVERQQSGGHTTLLDGHDLVLAMNALSFERLGQPGELFNYSNEGFCLLGTIIENLNAVSYPQAAADRVFAPLLMDRSVIGGARLAEFENIAMPLARQRDGFQTAGFWDAPLFYPAGGMVTTVRDMIRLIGLFGPPADILSEGLIRRACTMQQQIPSRPGMVCGYGFGLEITQLSGARTMIWHSGQRAGISSFAGTVIEEDLSVAICINLADAPAASIGHGLIGDLLDDASVRWPQSAIRRTANTAVLRSAGGVYGTEEGFRVTVSPTHDALIMTFRSEDHPFEFHGKDWGVVNGQTFRFLRDDQNAVVALALDLRVLPRL